ncbi:hypothetical protein QA640_32580 [Bradyrhizobium sp. CB82]|uniref:hypothetical protein n=1 Tax=Bradyrhizobium sp. CB82 TaxID=3039159 RepID=UPI0024B14ED5|nr:hypothetical protein [Bradyrhizobium sp. CB82]WFU39092.1 hypothetical protein QA640_32580 [Bradyrhizobium sp. CB82]
MSVSLVPAIQVTLVLEQDLFQSGMYGAAAAAAFVKHDARRGWRQKPVVDQRQQCVAKRDLGINRFCEPSLAQL